MPDATSTIAFSAYNFLVNAHGPVRIDRILTTIRAIQHQDLRQDQLEAALKELINTKNLVRRVGENQFEVIDRSRGIVVKRDRSDARKNTITEELEGGWTGWVFQRDTASLGGNRS